MPSDSVLTDLDQLILAFLAGFAVAALIFWPMLRRRRSRDRTTRAISSRGRESRSEGKHARRPDTTTPAPKTAAGTNTGTQPKSGLAVVAVHPTTGAPDESAETDVPEPRAQQPVELPPPADLFQQHYAVRFDRARNRAARIREQLDQA